MVGKVGGASRTSQNKCFGKVTEKFKELWSTCHFYYKSKRIYNIIFSLLHM